MRQKLLFMRQSKNSPVDDRQGMLLVVLQFVLLLFCFVPWPHDYGLNYGMIFLLLGVVLGLSALAYNRPGNFNIRPVYKMGAEAILKGPYQLFRHPMYVAVLLTSIGGLIMQQASYKWLAFILLFIVLNKKASLEEKAMSENHVDYLIYHQQNFRWLPLSRNNEKSKNRGSGND